MQKKSRTTHTIDKFVYITAFVIIGLLVGLIAINSPLSMQNRASTRSKLACGERCFFSNQCQSGKCEKNKCGGALCTNTAPEEGKIGVCDDSIDGVCDPSSQDPRFQCQSGLVCLQSFSSTHWGAFRCKCASFGEDATHPDCRKSFEELPLCAVPECPPYGEPQPPYRCRR